MSPTIEQVPTTRRTAPVIPAEPEVPTTDPLREVADEILVDCRILPDEYLRESHVPGGGE